MNNYTANDFGVSIPSHPGGNVSVNATESIGNGCTKLPFTDNNSTFPSSVINK